MDDTALRLIARSNDSPAVHWLFCGSDQFNQLCGLVVILLISWSALFDGILFCGLPHLTNSLGPLLDKEYMDIVQECAESWESFKESAEEGNSEGQLRYGLCLHYGKGVPQDFAEAANYLKLSPDQYNRDGEYLYAWCLLGGSEMSEDRQKGSNLSIQPSAAQRFTYLWIN
jgi:TPR repeat protein